MTYKTTEELRREFVDELARGYRANSFGLNKPLDSASEALLAAIDREKAASAELPVTMDDTGANGEFVFRPKPESVADVVAEMLDHGDGYIGAPVVTMDLIKWVARIEEAYAREIAEKDAGIDWLKKLLLTMEMPEP